MSTKATVLPDHLEYCYRASAPSERRKYLFNNQRSARTYDLFPVVSYTLGFSAMAGVIMVGIIGLPLWVMGPIFATLLTVMHVVERSEVTSFQRYSVLAPVSAAGQIQKVSRSLGNLALPTSRWTKKDVTPEIKEISREGVRLGNLYDKTLEQWAHAAWLHEHSPEAQKLEKASQVLADAIAECSDAMTERREWEKLRQAEMDAPLVLDAERFAEDVMAEAHSATDRISGARQQALLQTQILASLQKDKTPPQGPLAA